MHAFVATLAKTLKAGQGSSDKGLPIPPIGGRAASKRILGDKFIRKDAHGAEIFEDYFSESSLSLSVVGNDSDDSEVRARKRRKKIAVPEYSAWSSRRDASSVSGASSHQSGCLPAAAASAGTSVAATVAGSAPVATGSAPSPPVARADLGVTVSDSDDSEAPLPPPAPSAALPTRRAPPRLHAETPGLEAVSSSLPRVDVRLQRLQHLRPSASPSAIVPVSSECARPDEQLKPAPAAASGHFEPHWYVPDDGVAEGSIVARESADQTPSPELTPIPPLGTTLRVRRSTAAGGDFDPGPAGSCYSSVQVVHAPQQQRSRHRRHVAESTRLSTADFVELAGRAGRAGRPGRPDSARVAVVRDAAAAADSDEGYRQSVRSASKLPLQHHSPVRLGPALPEASKGNRGGAAVPGSKASADDSSCDATGSRTTVATASRSVASASSATLMAITPSVSRSSGSQPELRTRELYPMLEETYNNRQAPGSGGGAGRQAASIPATADVATSSRVRVLPRAGSRGTDGRGESDVKRAVSASGSSLPRDRVSRRTPRREDGSSGAGTHHQRTPGLQRTADPAVSVTVSEAAVRPAASILSAPATDRARHRVTPGSSRGSLVEIGEEGEPASDAELQAGADDQRSRWRLSVPSCAVDGGGPAAGSAEQRPQSRHQRRGSAEYSLSPDRDGSPIPVVKPLPLPRKRTPAGVRSRQEVADHLSLAMPAALAVASVGVADVRKPASADTGTATEAGSTLAKTLRLASAGASRLSSASGTTLCHSRSARNGTSRKRPSSILVSTSVQATTVVASPRVSAASILESQRAKAHRRRVSRRLYTPADDHLEAVDDRDADDGGDVDVAPVDHTAPGHSHRSPALAKGSDVEAGGEDTQPNTSQHYQHSAGSAGTANRQPASSASKCGGTIIVSRGRPRKAIRVATELQTSSIVRRGRGRPRKATRVAAELQTSSIVRRGRGRPRKATLVATELQTSPKAAQTSIASVADASLPSCSATPVHYHEMTHSSPTTLRAGRCEGHARVIVPDENPPDGLRRSRRVRVQTLRWDLFERILYGPGLTGYEGVHLRDELVNAPPKKKTTKGKAGKGRPARAGALTAQSCPIEELTASIVEAEDGVCNGNISIVIPTTNRTEHMDCVWSQNQVNYQQPEEPDGTVATYKFGHIFREANKIAVGHIILEPGGIKMDSGCDRDLFFTVTGGRIEVKIHGSTNKLSHLGTFRVPEGNLYSIRNLSARKTASLVFMQVDLTLATHENSSNDQQVEDQELSSHSVAVDNSDHPIYSAA